MSTAPKIWIKTANGPTIRPMAKCGQPTVAAGWAPYQNRPLGLGRLLWLDLGQLRSVGLGAVSLRSLVLWSGGDGLGIQARSMARHYWSPALVGFFGFGGGVGVGVGFGFGGIGWVPLAPFEVFHPWWGPWLLRRLPQRVLRESHHHRQQRECGEFFPQCRGSRARPWA